MSESVDIAVTVDTREAKAAMGEMEVSAKGLSSALGSAFTSLVVQGKDFSTVLEQLGTRLTNLALTAAFKPLETSFSSLLSSTASGLGFAKGGVFSQGAEVQGAVLPFAKGGVMSARGALSGPSLLAFAKGGVLSGSGALGSLLSETRVRPFAKGGVLSGVGAEGLAGVLNQARVRPFARGGVVAAPTYFPMSGASFGLMGEKGAEAIMPLTRGADGSLGVRQVEGGSRGSVTVNVATPDLSAFRRSDAYVSGLVARAVARSQRSA